jgi:Pyruvate/2-oxoacid:ferredoxin oxidoreductase delta subunit
MRPRNPPPPTYAFAYGNEPSSGNEINGLGVRHTSPARQVFHSTGRGGERGRLAWAALDSLFNLIASPGPFWQVLRTIWQRRLYDGPIAKRRIDVPDPAQMAVQIKTRARGFGAGIVGICQVTPHMMYDGDRIPYRYAISIGTPMDRSKMAHVPHLRAASEVMRIYRIGSRTAIRLARYIRSLGWPAQAYSDGEDILQSPISINAGLGQLGKHGSIISDRFGSNFRLAAVLTDMPLACDRPIDIGVDDLCRSCRRCVIDCPPAAIFNEKQWVRGVEKWYVDFDACVPYFTKTAGCAICIEVCPWSEPGRGERLTELMLSKRQRSGGEDTRLHH